MMTDLHARLAQAGRRGRSSHADKSECSLQRQPAPRHPALTMELMERMGQILGDECQAENVSILPTLQLISNAVLSGKEF